ncbi:unnamed protein product [Parascedosporium putredinis]|uniref:NACHT domain-containing protein n=1 Tax=Parascedosporium putredinis TaxID=1442378 RepID=A0A9P1H9G0_9PEZI|nr:unnamed protein product [Parascedosporium putredinis]CAI8000311.1 unnamed protein product [Parascedosporium putredinis]
MYSSGNFKHAGVERKDYHASLDLVSPPENEDGADVDIIAIPGLDTKSPDTWIWKPQPPGRSADASRSEVNWLKDPRMLPALVGSARIFTCDWPSRESTYALEQLIRDFTSEYQHISRNCQLAIFYEMQKLIFYGMVCLVALQISSRTQNCETKDRADLRRFLHIDQCYINLALVEHTSDDATNSSGSENDIPQSSPFSLTSRLKIEKLDATQTIALPALFDQRKVRGVMVDPRRVLIRGRAGVGKTTLCKKIILDFLEKRIWSDLYDRVLWVPLRNLQGRKAPGYNFEDLFYDEYFSQHPNGRRYAKELFEWISNSKGNRTLFLLDGLDEVAGLDNMETFLENLLKQPNYIITTRPHAKHSKLLRSDEPDLELETIGFQSEQVSEYLKATISDKQKLDNMQLFLRKIHYFKALFGFRSS